MDFERPFDQPPLQEKGALTLYPKEGESFTRRDKVRVKILAMVMFELGGEMEFSITDEGNIEVVGADNAQLNELGDALWEKKWETDPEFKKKFDDFQRELFGG